MLCYKDMTFCTANNCKNFTQCGRALTNKVKDDAQKWWGKPNGEAPIMVYSNPVSLECYVPKRN